MVLVEGRRRLERGVGGREKWVSGKEVDGNVGGKEKRVGNEGGRVRFNKWKYRGAVSYTHLTLPTILRV